ncbi:peptide chain release factor N(5)-glutamine methyltransferase [Arenibacter latericius]|uniref:peptide chain release factor N(5)-glutamine methyltransferase n=1 Tax=Arenibacter latericius TaxID=86104 RepID=UPI00041CB061|nr:peptide chain release factor N(5)-glutamine methyltransferase [Arenibacter latericius]MDX1364494.1 peptide chain release factor N(5)-glutamine methyltransferase [Arenibacter latericius]
MHLKEIKKIYHKELDSLYPKEEVDSFFYLTIEHYLGLERFVLVLEPNLTITKEEEGQLFSALSELRLQRPIQYVLGSTQFCDLDFIVNQNVLIPRPETEELVYWILDELRHVEKEISILDVGTGSGCIAISLSKYLSQAKVQGLDISKKALEVAKQNAIKNEVEVSFLEFDALSLEQFEGQYDVIVSNPPYVRELEKKAMKKNVLDYEPDGALFVPDEDPLLFYKSIVRFAHHHLKPGGMLFFEINQYLGEATKKLMQEEGFLELDLREDMYGNHRMLKGVWA